MNNREKTKKEKYQIQNWCKLHRKERSELSKKFWSNPENRRRLGITQSKRLTPEVRRKQGISKQKSWTPILGVILSKQITLGRNRQNAEKICKEFYKSRKGNFKDSSNLVPYKTQWQLTAFKKLDDNPLIKNWNFLTVAIQYKDLLRDKFSHIAIDLEVFYNDGTKKLILIRPDGMQLEHHEFNSLSYIEKYCIENKYSFEIWTKEAFTL